MTRRLAVSVLVCLLFTGLAAFMQEGAASRAIVVPDDYSSITEAIANAADGDVIYVRNGVYNESALDITKTVTIRGEDVKNTIVNLDPPLASYIDPIFGDTHYFPSDAVKINAPNVKISGLTITSIGGISGNGYGIAFVSDIITLGRSCSITGSKVTLDRNTITADSWRITGDSLTLNQNMINVSRNGIESNGSSCTITGNNIDGSLIVWGSSNTITNNTYDLLFVFYGDSNTIQNNIGEISLGNSDRSCSNNIVSGNLVKGPAVWGIWIGMHCKNNLIYDNYIVDEGYSQYGGEYSGGISVCYEFGHMGTSNTVYHNVFINNSVNVKFYENITLGGNAWDNGVLGNFWDDYNGTDANADGIGDTAYIINAANSDNHPLMAPFSEPSINVPLPIYDQPINITEARNLPIPTLMPTPTPTQTATNNPTNRPTTQFTIPPTKSPTFFVTAPEFPVVMVLLLASILLIAVAIVRKLKKPITTTG